MAALIDLWRRRPQQLRAGDEPSSTPSAARHSSASHVSADARRRGHASWRVYRLQLALGGAGLAASGGAGGRGRHGAHRGGRRAHRLRRRRSSPGLPQTFRRRRLLALAAARRRRPRRHGAAAWRRSARPSPAPARALLLPSARCRRRRWRSSDAAAPLAFCVGWLRPRVYVSAGSSFAPRRASCARSSRTSSITRRCATRCGSPSAACCARRCCSCPCCACCTIATRGARSDRRRGGARCERRRGGPLAAAMLAVGTTGAARRRHLPRPRGLLLGRPRAWRLPRLLLVAALGYLGALVALVWRRRARVVRHEPEPPDRLLAALRARAGARAGPRMPRRRRSRGALGTRRDCPQLDRPAGSRRRLRRRRRGA